MTMVGRWWSKVWTWFTGPGFDKTIEEIQTATVRCCGFLPTAATVAGIISAGNPVVITTSAIAAAICAAMNAHRTTAGLFEGEPVTPTVNGVPIEGEWIKR